MSAYLYDKAIVERFRRIFDNKIWIEPTDNVMKTLALSSRDDITFPFVSLTRTGWSISDSKSFSLAFEGGTFRYSEDDETFWDGQLIPMRLTYLLDVWTKTREENDNLITELVWYITTHPKMYVKIPYGLDIEHSFNIFLDSDIEDNSDIVQHQDRGEYFRQTLSIYTDDCYFWKSSHRGKTYIEIEGLEIENVTNEQGGIPYVESIE